MPSLDGYIRVSTDMCGPCRGTGKAVWLWPGDPPACPWCGGSGDRRPVRVEKAPSVALEAVVRALEDAYHPQNPLTMHPADFVTKKFEGPGHENLRYV